MVKVKSKKKKKSKLIWIIPVGLLILMIVFGIYFLGNICCGTPKITEFTDAQLRNEIGKYLSEGSKPEGNISLFSDLKMAIYPGTRLVQIKRGDTDGFGLGINNLLAGASGDKKFSYNVFVSDLNIQSKCGISAAVAESWIVTGKSEENIIIPSGDFIVRKVLFTISKDAPLCTIRFRVNVEADGLAYATDFFDMKIKAKR